MSLNWRSENQRESLAKGISESIASWDEDPVHDIVTAVLREAFSANHTYDGSHFEHAEFEDEALAKIKSIIQDIQDQKIEYRASLKARAFMNEMFNHEDPTWERITGRHVNEIA